MDSVLSGLKARYSGSVYGSDVIILRVTEGHEHAIIARLSEHPDVVFAEPDYLYSIAALPEDSFFGTQWGHTRLRSQQAWDIETGSTSIKIAIIDTGADLMHPDLVSKFLPGHSFLYQGQEDAYPIDLHGHGTHVSGIAAALTNNNTGIAGMSWGAKIIPVRVLDDRGDGWTTDIAAGINWARLQGADIINLSLGGEAESLTMKSAIETAYNEGVLVVASMGNSNSSTKIYPAAYPHVIAVTATTFDNDRAPYTNYGPSTDIAAPGGTMSVLHDSNGIFSTLPTYDVYLTTDEHYSTYYDTMYGTSQAAPFISGLAALIWSVDASLTPDEVTRVITSTAVDLGSLGWDPYYGYGLADARASLDMVNRPKLAPTLHLIDNPDQDGDYFVRWDPINRATGYRLEVSADPTFQTTLLVYSGADYACHVTGQDGGRWYYRVRAVNISGEGPWSSPVHTDVVPAAPMLLPISIGTLPDAYTLNWTEVTSAKRYVLQQSGDIAFSSPILRYEGADPWHAITGQSDGTWYYRVRAYNNIGLSEWSNIRTISVPKALLIAPNLYPIDNIDGDAAYEIQWTASPSTTIYSLEESDSQYFHVVSEIYTGPELKYSVANHLKGTWYYRVRGYTLGGSSPWSNTQKAIVISHSYLPMVLRQYSAPSQNSFLSNGDFEAGSAGWVQYSLKGYPLIVDVSYVGMKQPHSGDWATWMGGVLGEVAYLQQDIYISSSVPYLTFWHWVESGETVCGNDTVKILVNTDVVTNTHLCISQNTDGWVQRSVNLQPYSNDNASLVFQVMTNNVLNSNYYIDDISFASSPVANTLNRSSKESIRMAKVKPPLFDSFTTEE